MAAKPRIAILGIFVADLAFRAQRMPGLGETILGEGGNGRDGCRKCEKPGGTQSIHECLLGSEGEDHNPGTQAPPSTPVASTHLAAQ